jgi:hypothetical protein
MMTMHQSACTAVPGQRNDLAPAPTIHRPNREFTAEEFRIGYYAAEVLEWFQGLDPVEEVEWGWRLVTL